MTEENKIATPVAEKERITILDSLRGIAILGILLMNIPGFALPSPLCYGDLSVLKELGTLNYKVWLFIEMTVEGTQRALFSMLFGAGMILFLASKEGKVSGLMPAEYYFRRQLWLLVFGLVNAYVLLWFWDILFMYAICGMILFAFRRLNPKNLIIAALVCLVFQTSRDQVLFNRDKKMVAKGEMIAAIDTTQTKLSEDQKEALFAFNKFKEDKTPEAKLKDMNKSLRKVRGDYSSFYDYQSERSYRGETGWTFNGLWDVLIFMFLGIAFYKNGILIGKASMKTYLSMFVVCFGLGVVLTWLRLEPQIRLNFDFFQYTKQVPYEIYEVSRSFRAVGILGLIMVLYKSGLFKWLFALMRPVGQMAFTNYLMQSLMVGLFFYGVGFGMFGKLQRYEIYYVVAATWLIEIIWSHIWLRFFRFGPLEWAWRSLTYWELQPFRR